MPNEDQAAKEGRVKEIAVAVREWLITLILVLLLVFPTFIKHRLELAGFVKGSIAGFEWQAELKAAQQQASEASQTITAVESQLQALRPEVEQLRTSSTLSPEARDKITNLSERIDKTTSETGIAKEKLRFSLEKQQAIMQKLPQ